MITCDELLAKLHPGDAIMASWWKESSVSEGASCTFLSSRLPVVLS